MSSPRGKRAFGIDLVQQQPARLRQSIPIHGQVSRFAQCASHEQYNNSTLEQEINILLASRRRFPASMGWHTHSNDDEFNPTHINLSAARAQQHPNRPSGTNLEEEALHKPGGTRTRCHSLTITVMRPDKLCHASCLQIHYLRTIYLCCTKNVGRWHTAVP